MFYYFNKDISRANFRDHCLLEDYGIQRVTQNLEDLQGLLEEFPNPSDLNLNPPKPIPSGKETQKTDIYIKHLKV